jgi:hypothetical protein
MAKPDSNKPIDLTPDQTRDIIDAINSDEDPTVQHAMARHLRDEGAGSPPGGGGGGGGGRGGGGGGGGGGGTPSGGSISQLRAQAERVARMREQAQAQAHGASVSELRSQAERVARMREQAQPESAQGASVSELRSQAERVARMREQSQSPARGASVSELRSQAERVARMREQAQPEPAQGASVSELRSQAERVARMRERAESENEKERLKQAKLAKKEVAEARQAERDELRERRKQDRETMMLFTKTAAVGYALLKADRLATGLATAADPMAAGSTFEGSKDYFKSTLGKMFIPWMNMGSRTFQNAANWMKEQDPTTFDKGKATTADGIFEKGLLHTFIFGRKADRSLQKELEPFKDDPQELDKAARAKLVKLKEQQKELAGRGFGGTGFGAYMQDHIMGGDNGRARRIRLQIEQLETALGEAGDPMKGFLSNFRGPTSQITSPYDYGEAVQRAALQGGDLDAKILQDQLAEATRANAILTQISSLLGGGVPINASWR